MLDSFCALEATMHLHRFLSVILGMIVLILTSHSYSALYSEEVFFCTIVIFTFVASFMLLIAHLLHIISDQNIQAKYYDAWFHILVCPIVLISGMFMFAAAIDRRDPIESINTERTFASIIGMINGLNYGIIGFLTYRKLNARAVTFGEGLEWEDPLVRSQESKKSSFGSI